MFLRYLRMHQFRNYEDQELELTDGINVLLGENAQGKTNALEAIAMLAMGKSHRTQKDADLVMRGQKRSTLQASVMFGNQDRQLRLDLEPPRKRALINGIPQSKMTDFIGHFQAVLFAPEDLQLVKGSPSDRRRFLDMELGQTQPKYLYHLSQYHRTLQQRNNLLKQEMVDWGSIEAFEEPLIEHGVQLLLRRFHFIQQLSRDADTLYGTISDQREQLDLRYVCSLPGVDPTEETDLAASVEGLSQRYRETLHTRRTSDARLRSTSTGPHRDDLVFYLNGELVSSFASQGQQRTIALSLRLAEIEFIHRQVGEYPLLLLDDVLSELDDNRQRNLVLSMSEKVQTVITTTSLFHLGNELRGRARLFHVRSGIIQSEG